MKAVEILTRAGLQSVLEKDLARYKRKGATMPDGSEIVTPQEVAAKAAAEGKKKRAKKKSAKSENPEE